jgi:hypothetical protein
MNTARKVIASIFAPILVGVPILSVELKTNYSRSEGGSSWNPVSLYEYPMAWWGIAFATSIFLLILWGNKKTEQGGADQTSTSSGGKSK